MKTIFIGNTGSTPLGDLWVAVSENGLVAIEFPATQAGFIAWLEKRHGGKIEFAPEKVSDALNQLREYAAGKRREFSLPIDWSALNDFQQKALKITFAIPYGETRTYKEIAVELDNPRAARAVGRAEATNPMPIVLPCHRVVGSDGKLRGYGGGDGIPTKAWLLKMEKAFLA
jgi:methylated-DNA-[protein]-cysteine S-methyltransferase